MALSRHEVLPGSPTPFETAMDILRGRLDLVRSGERGRWIMLLEQRDDLRAYIFHEDVDSVIVGPNAGRDVVFELMRENGANPKQLESSADAQVFSGSKSLVFEQRGTFLFPALEKGGSGPLQPATEYWVKKV